MIASHVLNVPTRLTRPRSASLLILILEAMIETGGYVARLLFSPKALASLIRAGDSQQFGLDLKADRDAIINAASNAAMDGAIDLTTFGVTSLRGKRCASYSDYSTHLALRAIVRHLRKRHRVTLPARDRIVRGVIQTLLDGTPMIAIRRDITSFYESIPVEPLRNRLLYDTGTSSLVRQYLRSFFDAHCPEGHTHGLPRGIGLSALFAEMAMVDFDQKVRAYPGVFKYYRFSDDILIFSTQYSANLDQELVSALPQGMTFNSKKCSELLYPGKRDGDSPSNLDYLGYRFSTHQPNDKSISRVVRVAISDKKINRLKTRIILALRDYEKVTNYTLLRDRCRFATGNYKVRRNGNSLTKGATHVFSGIYYNYKLCGVYDVKNRVRRFEPYDSAELKSLDGFYHSLLKRRNSAHPGIFTPHQLAALRAFSFHRGYTDRIKVRFTNDRVIQIKRAWRNV